MFPTGYLPPLEEMAKEQKQKQRRKSDKRQAKGDKNRNPQDDERRAGKRNKIKDKYPDQLKLDFALWTREAVRQCIKQEYGLEMPIRTVGEYLKRWGFTPQRPLKCAYERNPKAVEEWLERTYPAVKSRAKEEKADIYWGDETTVKASDVRGRGYAPAGQTPAVNRAQKREDVSMVSAITNKGKVFWKLHEGSIDSEKFKDFAERLVHGKKRKTFLVLDNAKTHHSKILAEWAERNAQRIELFCLPAYSPDLNPGEHLNADLKYGVGSKTPRKTREALQEAAEDHMNMLRCTPQRIVSHFLDPAIKYASNV
jgi:transposase